MKPTVEVEGLAALTKKMRALDDSAPLAVKLINREAAEMVLPSALALVPHGETDLLSKSIRVGATARSGYVMAGGAKVPYAAPIHFGWPAHNVVATNFLTLAAQREEPSIVAFADRSMRALVRRVGLA